MGRTARSLRAGQLAELLEIFPSALVAWVYLEASEELRFCLWQAVELRVGDSQFIGYVWLGRSACLNKFFVVKGRSFESAELQERVCERVARGGIVGRKRDSQFIVIGGLFGMSGSKQ